MRKRWTWEPLPFVMLWLFGGFAGWMVLTALTNGCDEVGCGLGAGRISTVPIVAACVWFGPVIVAVCAVGIGAGAMVIWASRPRRVTEPVTTDAREAYRV